MEGRKVKKRKEWKRRKEGKRKGKNANVRKKQEASGIDEEEANNAIERSQINRKLNALPVCR